MRLLLKVPKLKGLTFEYAIIQRYQRRKCSVEEALVKMYLAGVSMRRVESISKVFPYAKYQHCTIHIYHNVFYIVPRKAVKLGCLKKFAQNY